MNCTATIFSRHAFSQMIEREISSDVVREVLLHGEVIKEYPDDKPFPSILILKFVDTRPIHIVASKDEEGNCIIITAYEPDLTLWNKDFKTKK